MEQIEEIIHVVVNKETGLLLDEIRTKSKFWVLTEEKVGEIVAGL
jgi:hypothetical protein